MHSYGEGWPEGRFNEVDEAGWYIGRWLARWPRMGVSQTKEKFGTVRVYCHFGWDSFYSIWRPRHCWMPKWWPWKLDLTVSKYIMPILNRIVVPMQKRAYVWRYRKAVQKWPHLYNEILCHADFGELFDGKIPGYRHSNFWTGVK